MIVETSRFGSVEVDDDKIIHFEDGLPGFENLTKYILLSPPELNPFHILQSIEDKDIALTIADPFLFKKDYAPLIKEKVFADLKIEDSTHAALFTTMVIPEDYRKMTANLMAPIVINPNKRLGKQVILDQGDYPVRYPIFDNQDGEVG
jgi:flagellar assembly factor FliW